jgi:hypothetical protein
LYSLSDKIFFQSKLILTIYSSAIIFLSLKKEVNSNDIYK